MEKPSFKLVGAPCGHHGQYTFYKAIKLTTARERIVAIGDFFFVRIWQDSELVSIGELQLLWTDRVSDQTLVSLRLYFLPENTPDGRNQHGEDEVLAISEKVVLKAEDLLSWISEGEDWRWGLKAVWRGACAPPSDSTTTEPLHHTRLDFSDVEKEKNAIAIEQDAPGVVVFSYPRYCRYRALVSRLEGIQGSWLRDSLVAALGGYAAPTTRTRILYCKDTFDYPELEGHEFVCNHLAPKLKGRPRGRRRRPPRSRTQSPDSRSSDDNHDALETPRRISLRNGPDKSSEDEDKDRKDIKDIKDVKEMKEMPPVPPSPEDEAFVMQLQQFYKDRNEEFAPPTLKHLSLRALYCIVSCSGGYDAVCRHKLWRVLFTERPGHTRRHYERYLLQYENHMRNGRRLNGISEQQEIPTIDVTDSPDTRQHTPKRDIVDSETGEIKEEMNMISKPAEELNREFLDSLPKEEKPAKITVKPVEKLIEQSSQVDREEKSGVSPEVGFLKDMTIQPHNGHAPTLLDQKPRPAGRSSLRAVRVKPNRPNTNTTPSSVSTSSSSSSTWSRSPPAPQPPTGAGAGAPPNNFGIHHPSNPPSIQDDDVQEVPYKPKTPEIIDLDEYPESPQSIKKKKLDILKEGGLEVTPLPTPSWPPLPTPITPILTPNPMLLNPVVQHQIMSNAQLFQMYNVVPNFPNGTQPPKVIQATSIFGTTSPEKTVYGNPKDPFMPPPHVIHGVPIKPQKSVQVPLSTPQDILDLTCKLTTKPETTKPTVEIVRVPNTPSPSKSSPQNLTKNYSIIDGKAVVGSNLEITLVNKNNPKIPPQNRPPQKRSSNGKFIPKTLEKTPPKKPPITIPMYPSPEASLPVPTVQKDPKPPMEKPPMGFLDPYMALYNFAGQMDPRQLAAYREIMTNQMKGYSNLLNMGLHPTTKN